MKRFENMRVGSKYKGHIITAIGWNIERGYYIELEGDSKKYYEIDTLDKKE